MNKKEIRALVKKKKSLLSEGEIRSYSADVSKILLESDFYRDADTIFAYLPYNQEIRTEIIIRQAWADGKNVCVPKVLNDSDMEFYQIDSFDNLEKSAFGIPEPKGDTPPVTADAALMIIPGVAFDKNKNRIGYGGGYYDRYLARTDTAFTKVALAYPFQIFDEIPTEEYDEKADEIIVKPA